MVNSPYHKLAKWLIGLLEPVTRDIKAHTLEDTFQLIDEIKDLNMVNTKMFSLDVNPLFINVPLKETIEYICNKNVGFPVNDLKQLLFLCTHNVQFTFNNEIYQQKDGAAMDSPLGPLLADIFN